MRGGEGILWWEYGRTGSTLPSVEKSVATSKGEIQTLKEANVNRGRSQFSSDHSQSRHPHMSGQGGGDLHIVPIPTVWELLTKLAMPTYPGTCPKDAVKRVCSPLLLRWLTAQWASSSTLFCMSLFLGCFSSCCSPLFPLSCLCLVREGTPTDSPPTFAFDPPLLVCGSLYFVNAFLPILRALKADWHTKCLPLSALLSKVEILCLKRKTKTILHSKLTYKQKNISYL